ncbi:hypothetical protein SUDANB180_00092 [Streptomyces sp. enrichment culture]
MRNVVRGGAATFTGRVTDAARTPLAAHAVQGVEGVVGVDCRLTAAESAVR